MATNDLVFPTELFGPVLETRLSVTPYFADTISSIGGNGHAARFWISNFRFFLAFMLLQGHLWHA